MDPQAVQSLGDNVVDRPSSLSSTGSNIKVQVDNENDIFNILDKKTDNTGKDSIIETFSKDIGPSQDS